VTVERLRLERRAPGRRTELTAAAAGYVLTSKKNGGGQGVAK